MAPEWEFISFTECENIPSMELLKKLGYKNLGYVPSLDSQAFGKWTTMDTEEEICSSGQITSGCLNTYYHNTTE